MQTIGFGRANSTYVEALGGVRVYAWTLKLSI